MSGALTKRSLATRLARLEKKLARVDISPYDAEEDALKKEVGEEKAEEVKNIRDCIIYSLDNGKKRRRTAEITISATM